MIDGVREGAWETAEATDSFECEKVPTPVTPRLVHGEILLRMDST